MSSSPVFTAEADQSMIAAFEQARANFRYFWRELSWEYRRIVPAVEMAAVKAPFSDPCQQGEDSIVEQMWITNIDFDGVNVKGILMNSPNELTSVKEEDEVSIPLIEISDWMYVIQNQVYGAYTVNHMRTLMEVGERRAHDKAWALDFGDPEVIENYPTSLPSPKKGLLAKLFGSKSQQDNPYEGINMELDHPAAINLQEGFDEALTEDPEAVNRPVDEGWSLLHMQALAGSRTCVEVLLKHGADKTAKTPQGHTPLELARILGWAEVERLLS